MSQKPMTEIEEHVREVLSTAREEGRREIDRCILANAIGVIDKERERANAAEKKLAAIVDADKRYRLWLNSDVEDLTYDDAPDKYEAALKAARGEDR